MQRDYFQSEFQQFNNRAMDTIAGLHAIANLTLHCHGDFTGKDEVEYNETYMRDHLIYCLEKNYFIPFPRVQTKVKVNKKKPKVVNIPCHCPCGKPDVMEEMIGCDGLDGTCDVWKHLSCANVAKSVDHDDCCQVRRRPWRLVLYTPSQVIATICWMINQTNIEWSWNYLCIQFFF